MKAATGVSVTLGPDTGVAHLPAALGGSGHVAFEVRGEPGTPVVVVLGGISAGRHLASGEKRPERGWWEDQVGPGRGLDPTRFRLVSLDWLAGPGASGWAAGTTAAAGADAPSAGRAVVTPLHQAEAVVAVLDALEVERAHAVVGASYGGNVALALAEARPRRLARLVVLCAAHATHPMATALRSLQRRIVDLAREAGREDRGLALARALAMTTYRTDREFAGRFDASPRWTDEGPRFAVEEYLDARGAAFARSFGADAFLALSESLDLHVTDPARIVTPTWLLASRWDRLVPLWQVRELAAALGGPVRCTELPSRFGHDAFLKETGSVTRFLRRALVGPAPGAR